MSLRQQLVGLVIDYLYPTVRNKMTVVIGLNGRSTSEHDAVGSLQSLHRSEHRRQIVFDLLFAGACEQGNNGFIIPIPSLNGVGLFISPFSFLPSIFLYFIFRGIAHIVDGIMVFLLEEGHLERQDREEFIHITTDLFDAVLLPCPYFRRDIVINRTKSLRFHIFGDAEVEARVIHKDYNIRAPSGDVFLTLAHISQNGAQMEQHGDEAHIGQFAVVLYQGGTLGCHQVASKTTELSLCIFLS